MLGITSSVQPTNTHNIDQPGHIVGEHVQRHCSHRDIRLSLPMVHLDFNAQEPRFLVQYREITIFPGFVFFASVIALLQDIYIHHRPLYKENPFDHINLF